MQERRAEPRMLCSDLVGVEWRDNQGKLRKCTANLEDISHSGACIQVERPIPLQTKLRLTHPKGILPGTVRWCVFREIGYFLGIEFAAGARWSRRDFRPRHMLDPRKLAEISKDTPDPSPKPPKPR